MKHLLKITLLLVLCFTLTACDTNEQEVPEPEIIYEDFEGTTRRITDSILSTLVDAYKEEGTPYYNPDSPVSHEEFASFLQIVEDKGTGVEFDYDTVDVTSQGFFVEIAAPLDAWGHTMTAWIEMHDVDAGAYVLSVASPAWDGEMQFADNMSADTGIPWDDVVSQTTNVG